MLPARNVRTCLPSYGWAGEAWTVKGEWMWQWGRTNRRLGFDPCNTKAVVS